MFYDGVTAEYWQKYKLGIGTAGPLIRIISDNQINFLGENISSKQHNEYKLYKIKNNFVTSFILINLSELENDNVFNGFWPFASKYIL